MVRGKVGSSYSDWSTTADSSRQIFTFYELSVSEVLKGELSHRTITIREFGGEKDGIGMQIPGTSQFSKDEDVVVFLSKQSDGSYQVQGMTMGKLDVQIDTNGEEYLAGAAINNSVFIPGEFPKKWTLQDVRTLIKQQQADEQAKISRNPGHAEQRPPQNPAVHTPREAAPQLQPEAQEDLSSRRRLLIGSLAVAAAFLVGFLIRWRRK